MSNRKTSWLISVRLGQQRKDIHIISNENETPQDTYRRVKQKAEKISEKLEDAGTVDIISRSVAFKPKGKKPHKSWYWCPYCNKWRVFLYSENLSINQCNICGISDKDYYVKKYNDIWKKEMGNKKIKL